MKVSTVVAAILNLLFPGAGNIYMGQITKGVIFCIITVIIYGVVFFTCGIGLVLFVPYVILMIIDAARLAERINRGETIGEWQFF